MAKGKARPAWFKMFRNQKTLIDSVSDEAAGKALKAIFQYFDSEEIPENLDPLVFAVFSAVKPYIDESFEDYRKAVESGRRGANTRWKGKRDNDNGTGNKSL